MKIVVILWYDLLLKRDVCELHSVESENLAEYLASLKSRAAYEKNRGFEDKHRFIVVDKMMAFI